MSRLLNANFARLFKSKLFYICAGISFAFALIEVIKAAFNKDMMSGYPEGMLFSSSGTLLLFCETVLVGIFVSVEHGGALRNKIISGKSRTEIFFANAITCSAAAAMLQFIFAATILLTGLIFGGKFILSFGETALCELLQLASLIEMCVIASTVSLLNQQKFGGAIWSLVIVLVLLVSDSVISGMLNSLKYSEMNYSEDALVGYVERTNITEDERLRISILETIRDVTPFGQQAQIKEGFSNAWLREMYADFKTRFPGSHIFSGEKYQKIPIPVEILPYSLGMIAVSITVGALIFRKKDIK